MQDNSWEGSSSGPDTRQNQDVGTSESVNHRIEAEMPESGKVRAPPTASIIKSQKPSDTRCCTAQQAPRKAQPVHAVLGRIGLIFYLLAELKKPGA